jgi:hypothetical protein
LASSVGLSVEAAAFDGEGGRSTPCHLWPRRWASRFDLVRRAKKCLRQEAADFASLLGAAGVQAMFQNGFGLV